VVLISISIVFCSTSATLQDHRYGGSTVPHQLCWKVKRHTAVMQCIITMHLCSTRHTRNNQQKSQPYICLIRILTNYRSTRFALSRQKPCPSTIECSSDCLFGCFCLLIHLVRFTFCMLWLATGII